MRSWRHSQVAGGEVNLYYQPKQRSAAKAVTLQVTEAQASI
jgi:hypothetical protein